MEVSSEIRITVSLKKGSVYKIDGLVPNPHYFVVLGIDETEGIIFVQATSQVPKAQLRNYRMGFPPETLVVIPANEQCFPRETAFDCNDYQSVPKLKLIELLEAGKLVITTDSLPVEITNRLIAGIKASILVEPRIKDLLVLD